MIFYRTDPIKSHIIPRHILNIFISAALDPLPVNFVKIFLIPEFKSDYRSSIIQPHATEVI